MVPNNSIIIQPNISPLIQYQFPQFYQDNYPVFLAFVRFYYQFLEQQPNPSFYSRNFLSLTDIDNTLDSFLVYFKEKYFVNIQFNTEADTRQLIKHALDIYRSKGTEREIQLLFQLLFNEQPTFYYPKVDIFRLSDGNYYIPTYLELTVSQNNILLNQKEVIGVTSRATAFIDSIIRRRGSQSPLNDVAYISSIIGQFQTGERIIPTDGSVNATLCPLITGSLTNIIVSSVGNTANYNIGDLVSISSSTGEGAVGRVTEVSSTTGLLEINLNDGGYGYTANAVSYISNTVLIANVQNITNSYARSYFKPFESIIEPMATLNYISANGNFSVGDIISAYSNSTTFSGNGTILTITTSNSTTGSMLVSTISGSLNANLLVNQGNAVGANLATSNGYTNSTATGKINGYSNTLLFFLSSNGTFVQGEQILQFIDNGAMPLGSATIGSVTSLFLGISNTDGVFRPGLTIQGQTSQATATVSSISINLGVVNTVGQFFNLSGTYYTTDSTNGVITIVSTGTGAGFGVSNTLLFAETVPLNTDLLSTYANVLANATTYGFPANASINATSGNVAQAMTYVNTSVGKIGSIIQFSEGSGYQLPQSIVVVEPKVLGHQQEDVLLYLTGLTNPFITGELITQSATSARGLVLFSNTSIAILQNMRYNANNQFVETSNSSTTIVSSNTGLTANVTTVVGYSGDPPEGFNANLDSSTSISTGSISSLVVVDSGFNYVDGQAVTFGNNNGFGTGIAQLLTQGKGTGIYLNEGGFTSDEKSLYDGNFYQEFSYQIQSSQTLDKYEQTLKQLAHVAGFKLFGQVVHKSSSNVFIDITPSNVTITTTS